MIAFDHREGTTSSKHLFENRQRVIWTREMFQNEADENVIERFSFIRQSEDVCLLEFHIR